MNYKIICNNEIIETLSSKAVVYKYFDALNKLPTFRYSSGFFQIHAEEGNTLNYKNYQVIDNTGELLKFYNRSEKERLYKKNKIKEDWYERNTRIGGFWF